MVEFVDFYTDKLVAFKVSEIIKVVETNERALIHTKADTNNIPTEVNASYFEVLKVIRNKQGTFGGVV